jgi:hypothetical protein
LYLSVKVKQWYSHANDIQILVFSLGLAVLLEGIIHIAGSKRLNAPYPDKSAGTDPETIAHGEYLVYGLAHYAT